MKKKAFIIASITMICLLAALLSGCGKKENPTFQAYVTEIEGTNMTVTPVEGSAELSSSDIFVVPMENMEASPQIQVGDIIEIEYNGEILESYPASLGEIYNISVVVWASTITDGDGAGNADNNNTNDSNNQDGSEAQASDAEIVTPIEFSVTNVNWSDDTRILSYALNGDRMIDSSVLHLPVYKLASVEEIQAFIKEFGDIMLLDERFYSDYPSFSEICEEYDEEFFKNNSVVMAYVEATSGSFRFNVDKLAVKDGILCMYITMEPKPEMYTEDMAGWLMMAAVANKDIEGCTGYDAQLVQ